MMIQTGETPMSQTSRADRIGIQTIRQVPFIARHVVMTGIAIIATTAGRMPYMTRCTQTLSLTSW